MKAVSGGQLLRIIGRFHHKLFVSILGFAVFATPTLSARGFLTQKVFRANVNPDAVSAGDINGDGKVDLLVSNSTGIGGSPEENFTVLLGIGNGSFQPERRISTTLGFPKAGTLGDFNNDGSLINGRAKCTVAIAQKNGDHAGI